MPLPAPTDELALALDHLMHSVAASSSFQSWTGTVDEATALARVHPGEGYPDDTTPLAVAWVKTYSADRNGSGAADTFDSTGQLVLQLVAEVESGDRKSAYIDMLNRVGAVRKDLLARSGQAGYLAIMTAMVRAVYRLEDPDSKARGKDLWFALLEIAVRP